MSKPEYRLTSDAQSDLIKIRQFTLEKWGVEQSKKYLSELRHTLQLIAEKPSVGKSRVDVAPNVMSFPYASHIIYYIAINDQVVIFGVLHKRMVPSMHLSARSAS